MSHESSRAAAAVWELSDRNLCCFSHFLQIPMAARDKGGQKLSRLHAETARALRAQLTEDVLNLNGNLGHFKRP